MLKARYLKKGLVGQVGLVFWIAATNGSFSQDAEPLEPVVAAASDEGQKTIAQFKFPANLVVTLFAAEPDVANPVAIDVDFRGRLFVCESFRQEKGVEDNREHGDWLDEDLAAQSVADRVAYMKRHYPDEWKSEFESHDDRLRLLEDTDKDGVADSVNVFSNHYNGIAMGTGAGVLHYQDNVYFTCIPDLWLLKDVNNDGVADERKALHNGFGVRFAFRGHDLHGLIVGPDGRLYFSIGDRGYNLGDGLHDPTSGAVFRCELDGSNLEVVATGLRNPQELAFDDFGNLFTGDNNSDSGDKARWVYVVAGGDSGWRMYYQYLDDRGPFNREKIWEPYDPEVTPTYIVPPIDNLSDGPSGLAYYPGTGFGDQFARRFFLCDFRGTSANSGIRTFKNEADGAFFRVTDMDETFWKMLATDIDFGPDGKIYVSDWVFGWVGENKGRVYTFHDPQHVETAIVKQVTALLGGGIRKMQVEALVQLLGHPDRRVRQEAQFELADRNQLHELQKVASQNARQLARLHAIWGIGQIARAKLNKQTEDGGGLSDETVQLIKNLLTDPEVEIRAHAAKLAGESRQQSLATEVADLMADENLRVRHFGALAMNKIGNAETLFAVVRMLKENDNKDPIVRHSGIMALAGLAKRGVIDDATLTDFASHESVAVRLAATVALRKIGSPRVAKFLEDLDPRVQLEAARTIHDLQLDSAMPQLAAMIDRITGPDALVRRVINANVRLGKAENAQAIARFAANSLATEPRRLDSLKMLAAWEHPQPRDPVLGDWRPLPKRDWTTARDALAIHFGDIMKGSEPLVEQAIATAGILKLSSVGKDFKSVALSENRDGKTRAAALISLSRIEFPELGRVVDQLEKDFSQLPDELAGALIEVLVEMDVDRGFALINEVFNADDPTSVTRKRFAIQALGEMSDSLSADKLSTLMNAITYTEYIKELRLDIANACAKRPEEFFAGKLAAYRKTVENGKDPTSRYRDTLFGGNAAAGKKIFSGKTEVSCVRCHKINAVGGEVGPDLSKIALTRDRQYLLESIIVPNKTIAEGFGQIVVATEDGLTHTGIIKEQNDRELKLMDADGNIKTILQDEIEDSRTGLSSMPEDLVEHLSMTEIRDLIEYLANRTEEKDDRVNKVEGHR